MTTTGTYTTVNAVGIREDLEDVIYRIDPTDTPVVSAIGKGKASAKLHEWQIQKLAATNSITTIGAGSPASGDAALDGADAPTASTTPTSRVGNRTQIMTRQAIVSRGLQAVNTAGRANEMEYQVLLKGLEMKRQIEVVVTQNQGSQADNGTNPGLSAGFEAWLTTNATGGTSYASTGFSGGTCAKPTDGTQRAFSETILKSTVASIFSAGGKPTMMVVGANQKQVVSGFAGLSQTKVEVGLNKSGKAKIVGAADVYVSDFGSLMIVPDLFSRNRTALIVSPKFAKVAYLRSMKNWPIAQTGDADKRQLLVEFTLEMNNEAAHGLCADLV